MNKLTISNITDAMVDGLCNQWGYPATVAKMVDVKEDGKVVGTTQKQVPNKQPKIDFVKAMLCQHMHHTYLVDVRAADRVKSDKAAVAKVDKEVKLK